MNEQSLDRLFLALAVPDIDSYEQLESKWFPSPECPTLPRLRDEILRGEFSEWDHVNNCDYCSQMVRSLSDLEPTLSKALQTSQGSAQGTPDSKTAAETVGLAGDTLPVILGCLTRLDSGDQAAWDELTTFAFDRYLDQCERILGQNKTATGDSRTATGPQLAEARRTIRNLVQSDTLPQPKNAREFFALTAQVIRGQILNTLDQSATLGADTTVLAELTSVGSATQPDHRLWGRFWETADKLADDEREVFDLIWTNGLSSRETAGVTGLTQEEVDTIWRRDRMRISRACAELGPMS